MRVYLLVMLTCATFLGIQGQSSAAAPSGNSTQGEGEPGDSCLCVQKDECKDEPSAKATPECGDERVCCKDMIVRTEKTVETHSFFFRNARKLEGNATFATAGEFPWHVVLFTDREDFVCSGVLISERYVLSSADCVRNYTASQLKARFAQIKLSDPKSETNARAVLKITAHPQHKMPYLNNIAVMELLDKVSADIRPVVSASAADDFQGKRCLVVGFGKDREHGALFTVLKKVDIPVLNRTECEVHLKSRVNDTKFSFPEGSLCAGGEEGLDACAGDDGGPLVCERESDKKMVLAAIVSYSNTGCGQLDIPGVFASVPAHLKFIERSTGLSTAQLTAA